MKKTGLTIICVLLLQVSAFAEDGKKAAPFIQAYDDFTFCAGIPLNAEVNRETMDIKFKIGVRTRTLCSPGGWNMFIGYRQSATWNAFATSGPFVDILFRPGIYFRKYSGIHSFTAGIEHLSNGRPFFGNKAAAPGYDDGSRGMNYLLFDWKLSKNGNIFSILAKAGVGCGVGSYERHCQLFTQDLFLYYLGYLTFDYSHLWNKFGVHASVTPIWNESIANVTLDSHWNFHPKWPGLFLEFHYGFDEALCKCSPEYKPIVQMRLGLKYSFPD